MDKTKIEIIARRKGMKNVVVFVEFFSTRFPNENNEIESYVSEWVDRFLTGNPMAFMDIYSKKIYKKIIEGK